MTLPIHPRTGLLAVGVLPSGRIVWPVLGGSGEGDGGGSGSGDGDGPKDGNAGGTPPADKTFTQADVDRIVADRLGRERGKFQDYDQLKAAAEELNQLKDAQASEAEKATKQAAKDAEARIRGQLEPELMRLRAAIAHGLPEEFGKRVMSAAKRLVGTTQEELETDAAEFFASTAPIDAGPPSPAPTFDQGARGGAGTAKATVASGREMYRELLGKKT